MYKRVLISVGTVVVLILVAACGFMLGNRVKGQTQDTGNDQSAYMSSEQEDSEYAAAEGDEDTVQTASDENTAQVNPSEDSEQIDSYGEVQSVSGDSAYIIFAEDGTLVVYYSDAATVYFDSGIEVQHLPEETRNQLEQGITFQSEEELFGFLESYSS